MDLTSPSTTNAATSSDCWCVPRNSPATPGTAEARGCCHARVTSRHAGVLSAPDHYRRVRVPAVETVSAALCRGFGERNQHGVMPECGKSVDAIKVRYAFHHRRVTGHLAAED